MKHLLLLTSHSIAEYDDHRMLSDLGYDVFSIGAYTDPAKPGDDKRPPLPYPAHPDLAALCIEQREKHAGQDDSFVIDWAKGDLHPSIIDWADVVIVHHYPLPWIGGNWTRLREKRVIWRTCGQSDPWLERQMRAFRRDGLEIVRYSPKERTGFGTSFAGEDALIRFGKYPSDYGPWIGDNPVVGNVSQWGTNLDRADALNLGFWRAATADLPTRPAGPGSEALPGGLGALSYEAMLGYLRHLRAYLYTGTRPASYTLGLIEAMLSGVPVVSIGAQAFGIPELFEGREIAVRGGDDVAAVRRTLANLLAEPDRYAPERQIAVELFGMATIGRQWADYLGGSRAEFSFARQAVTA